MIAVLDHRDVTDHRDDVVKPLHAEVAAVTHLRARMIVAIATPTVGIVTLTAETAIVTDPEVPTIAIVIETAETVAIAKSIVIEIKRMIAIGNVIMIVLEK